MRRNGHDDGIDDLSWTLSAILLGILFRCVSTVVALGRRVPVIRVLDLVSEPLHRKIVHLEKRTWLPEPVSFCNVGHQRFVSASQLLVHVVVAVRGEHAALEMMSRYACKRDNKGSTYVDTASFRVGGRVPVDDLVSRQSEYIAVQKASGLTLCPAFLTALARSFRPRRTGGCGSTKPSLQSTPIFSGLAPAREPRAEYASNISCRYGTGTTAGSLAQGWVERRALKPKSMPSREVPISPTADRHVYWPGACAPREHA